MDLVVAAADLAVGSGLVSATDQGEVSEEGRAAEPALDLESAKARVGAERASVLAGAWDRVGMAATVLAKSKARAAEGLAPARASDQAGTADLAAAPDLAPAPDLAAAPIRHTDRALADRSVPAVPEESACPAWAGVSDRKDLADLDRSGSGAVAYPDRPDQSVAEGSDRPDRRLLPRRSATEERGLVAVVRVDRASAVPDLAAEGEELVQHPRRLHRSQVVVAAAEVAAGQAEGVVDLGCPAGPAEDRAAVGGSDHSLRRPRLPRSERAAAAKPEPALRRRRSYRSIRRRRTCHHRRKTRLRRTHRPGPASRADRGMGSSGSRLLTSSRGSARSASTRSPP